MGVIVDPTTGIQIEYSDDDSGRAGELRDALFGLSPEIRKLMADGDYKKIKFGPLDDKGRTDPCHPFWDPDITLSNTNMLPQTLSHEAGHALDDVLGEQNGKQEYHDSSAFQDALNADNTFQPFYEANPNEFIGDLTMAMVQTGIGGNPNAVSSYSGLTAQQIADLYPNSLRELKQQMDFATAHPHGPITVPNPTRSCFKSGTLGGWGDRSIHYIGGFISSVGTFGTDPLVLDLDGNGVQTTTVNDGIYFNVGNNGFVSKTAWAAGNDAVLGIDNNSNGILDDGTEIVGMQQALAASKDSFVALATLDSNHDGMINSSDADFSKLLVSYSDGKTKSLSDLGITSINLSKTPTNIIDGSGNTQMAVSNFTRTDNSTGVIGSYVLQQNSMDSISLNQVDIDPTNRDLPDAHGYGVVEDLSQVIQKDSTGQLRSLVESFLATTDLEQQDQLLQQIIVRWTGSQDVAVDVPGSHIDGQVLAALEKFSGTTLTFPGNGGVPGWQHQAILLPIFTGIKEEVYAQLMFNNGPLDSIGDMMQENSTYDVASGERRLNLQPVADYLLQLASDDVTNAEFVTSEFLRSMRGLNLFAVSNYQDFYDEISGSSPELKSVIDNFGVNPVYHLDNETIDRTSVPIDENVTTYGNNNHVVLGSGNDTFTAHGTDTWLSTGTGSYNITLGGGDNKVYLGPGSAVLNATGGTNDIRGNTGDDTLNFTMGSGNWKFTAGNTDIISHTDKVNFGAGLDLNSLTLSASPEGSDLILKFGESPTDSLTLKGELAKTLAKQISQYTFADGTTLTAEQLGQIGFTFDGSESHVSYDHGGSYVKETFNLSGSNDVVKIGSAANTLNITGSANSISGGNGDDTYSVTGTSNQVFVNTGTNFVNAGGTNNQFFFGASGTALGTTTIVDTGSGNQFSFAGSIGGGASLTLGHNAVVTEGGGSSTFTVLKGAGITTILPFGKILNPGDSDTIKFGVGVTASDLYFSSPAFSGGAITNEDLDISYGANDVVVLTGGLANSLGDPITEFTEKGVEHFTFADASSISMADVLAQGVHVVANTQTVNGPIVDRRFSNWREITTIVGSNGFLYEGKGDDVIVDTGNNNFIFSGKGNNTITVGTNSIVESDLGTNQIWVNSGFGSLTIHEEGLLGGLNNNGNDSLSFYSGVTASSLVATAVGDGSDLQLTLANGDSVLITGELFPDSPERRTVSAFNFADGSSFTAQQLIDMSPVVVNNSLDNVTVDRSASTGNERINNSGHFDTILMGAGSTTVVDTGSNNTIYGGSGPATINASANNTIFVGSGSTSIKAASGDIINGGSGDATITVGSGVSGVNVFEQTAGAGTNGYDSVVLSGAVSVNEYTLSSVGKDLTLTDSLGTSVLTLKDGLDSSAVAKPVQDFSFSNGSHISFSDLIQRGVAVSDSSSNTTVDRSFSTAKETITHTGSNDSFTLGSGETKMTVGTNDSIHSGKGTDTFNVSTGSGSTTIIEDAQSVTGGASDFVQLLNPVDSSEVTVSAVGSNFTLGFASGDSVTLVNQLDGASVKNVGAFFNSDGSVLVDSAEIQQIANNSRATADADNLTGSRFGDLINGGDGNDVISAGLGNDNISGGAGDDILSGDAGNDFLYGDDGDDTLNGGAGQDVLTGYAGADTLNGGDGNDILAGGLGNDFSSGGTGDDTYVYNLGDGVDTIDDGAGALGGGNDKIELGALRSNVQFTAQGDDLRISFTQSAESVLVQGFLSSDTSRHIELVQFSDGSNISYSDIVGLVSSPPGQDIYGTNAANTLTGTAGNDNIYALSGNDTVNAGAGNDLVYGGNGIDTLNGQDGNDQLFGEAGVDTLYGGNGMDALDGGSGNDYLSGDDGDDVLMGGTTGADELHGGNGNDSLDGGSGNDVLYGDSGNDTLAGGTGNDYLYGGVGDDSLDGEAGSDFLYGMDGNDTLAGGGGNDTLDGGAGDDNLDGGDGADFLYGMAGNDVLSGGTGVDTIDGGDGDDTISGGTGNDVLIGGDGNDHIDAGTGNDNIHGGAGNDILIGGGGNDTIAGDDGNDSIYGDTGNDTLTGGTGTDYIEGKAGVDTLTGGTGNDTLVGGEGNDTYLFSKGDGVDVVNDQGKASDHMDTIRFGAGVTTQDVAFYMQGNDLYLSQGTGDSIQVTNQNTTTSKIEKFELDDGHFVSSADVNLIIQQIAAYQQQHTEVNIANVNDVRNNQDLMTIVSNNWHAA